MSGSLASVFQIPELRKKIFLTLTLLFIYRIGFHIPLPGVDLSVLRGWMGQRSQDDYLGLGLMSILSGGSLSLPFVFSLGILPYISASIIFSLLVKVVPRLEALSKEGASGQKKINQLTRLATVPLCLVQGGVLVSTRFRGFIGPVEGEDTNSLLVPGLSDTFSTALFVGSMMVVGMTAGTLFIMWLGEQITEHGVGNGASLIIMAGILAGLPGMVWNLVDRVIEDRSMVLIAALLLVSYVVVVFGVVIITKGQRRIPIQQAKLMKGRKLYGGSKHYLPIKVNMASVMPVIFASALLGFPNLIANAFGSRNSILEYGGFWWLTLFVGLIFFFSFFWTSMMFQPTEMANNLKEYGSFVPGIRPGRKTAEYLERIMVRITLVGSAFLATVAVIPNFIASALPGVNPMMAQFLGGTTILIVVGVALDLVDKLNSQLLMRNYDGFMSASATKRGRRGA